MITKFSGFILENLQLSDLYINESIENKLTRVELPDSYKSKNYETHSYEYYDKDKKVGKVDIDFSYESPFFDGSDFYINYIEVEKNLKNSCFGCKRLTDVINLGKEFGADYITLKVENGLGFGGRENNRLSELYLRHGFKYMYDDDELKKSDEKNQGAMILPLK